MKKTLKIGMLAAAAVLMVLTGCKNSFAPTTPSEDSFKAEVTRTNATYNGFKIMGVAHKFYGDSNNEKLQVTIAFTQNVTVDGVKNGVRFYKLTDADKSWTMPAKAPLSVAEADIKVDGTNAYFTVGTKGVDHLYVFVEAAKTQAESGASLNQDGDDEWAEKHDDDYAYYQAIGSSTLKGNPGFDRAAASTTAAGYQAASNSFLSTVFMPTFQNGSDSSDQLVTTVDVDATTFNGTTWLGKMDGTSAVFDDAEKTAARSTAAGLLTKHLKAEYYNWKESKWVTVDLSFSYKEIEADVSTFTAAFKGWRSNITLEPNRQIRFKWVDTKDMKMELKKTYGYPIKYSLNDTNADSRVKVANDSSTSNSGFLYDFTNHIWPGIVAADKDTAGKVTLTLQVPASAVGFGNHKYSASDKTGYKVTETNPEWTLTDQKKSLFAGFAASAADHPAYFKCFDSSDQEIAIEKASLLQSSVDTYPEAWDQLVIYFKDSTKQAAKVYISPEVTSAAFKGSYVNQEGKRVAIDIPSLSLADVNANADPNVLGGWLQK